MSLGKEGDRGKSASEPEVLVLTREEYEKFDLEVDRFLPKGELSLTSCVRLARLNYGLSERHASSLIQHARSSEFSLDNIIRSKNRYEYISFTSDQAKALFFLVKIATEALDSPEQPIYWQRATQLALKKAGDFPVAKHIHPKPTPEVSVRENRPLNVEWDTDVLERFFKGEDVFVDPKQKST